MEDYEFGVRIQTKADISDLCGVYITMSMKLVVLWYMMRVD